MKTLTLITLMIAGLLSASPATTVFTDDFESPVASASDNPEFTSQQIDTANQNGTVSALRATDPIAVDITGLPVPEPSTTALIGLGGLALIMRRRQ